MKLAQALTLRKDIQIRMNQLVSRLNDNAKVQEGLQPNEDPYALLNELEACHNDYVTIVNRINLTNTMTIVDGERLGDLVVKRDALIKLVGYKRRFLDEASRLIDRYSKSEILVKSTVNVSALHAEIDAMAREIRERDTRIQELNWTTELL